MYYLQSRYYSPEICRFINADDSNIIHVTNGPLTVDLFSYCNNNAINMIDNSGYLSIALKNYRAVSWLAKFILKSVNVVTEQEKTIAEKNIWWLGVKIAMSTVAGTSSNTKGFFTLKKSGKNLSCSIAGMSFSSNGKFGITTSLSLFSASVTAFVNLSNRYLTFGMGVFHNLKKGNKKVYLGVKLAISISYVTLATMAFIGVLSSIFVPALAPIVSKIGSTIAVFTSNPYGLSAGVSSIVGLMRALA